MSARLPRILQGLRKNGSIAAFVVTVCAFIVVLGLVFFYRGKNLMESQLRERLRETAAVAALQFDPAMVERVHGKAELTDPDVRTLVQKLHDIRSQMPSIRFAYLMRHTANPWKLEFVADADSLASAEELDRNHDGVVLIDEKPSYPGDLYDISLVPALQKEAFAGPTVDQDITTDAWGSVVSGYAPILDSKGQTVAVLGIDMNAVQYTSLTHSIFSPIAFLLVSLAAILLAAYIGVYIWRRRMELLEKIDEERSGMMLLASHQLGTPLTIFQWTLESIRDSRASGELEKDMDVYLHNMDDGVQRISAILTNLRKAADVDEGSFLLKPEWGSLSSIIEEVANDLNATARARKQDILFMFDKNLNLSCDRALIAQVVRELLTNALTFSPDGTQIEIFTRQVKDEVEVEVRDHGCGIDSEDLSRIFGKFVRGKNAHISRPDGNGLGLYIAQGIIRKSGGDIRILSQNELGTRVIFTLPIGKP